MIETFVPVTDIRRMAVRTPPFVAGPRPGTGVLLDRLGRPLTDLRISVTDRCNFRCSYCMPKEVFDSNYRYLPQTALLSFEEITRLARQFVAHGVRKIRLTGGEPLLRKNIEVLIEQLSALRTLDGEPLDTVGYLAPPVLRAHGVLGGQLSVALQGFDHPGLDRVLQWDLRHAAAVCEALAPFAGTPARRALLDASIEGAVAALAPNLLSGQVRGRVRVDLSARAG